jgi:hypothetical protein
MVGWTVTRLHVLTINYFARNTSGGSVASHGGRLPVWTKWGGQNPWENSEDGSVSLNMHMGSDVGLETVSHLNVQLNVISSSPKL